MTRTAHAVDRAHPRVHRMRQGGVHPDQAPSVLLVPMLDPPPQLRLSSTRTGTRASRAAPRCRRRAGSSCEGARAGRSRKLTPRSARGEVAARASSALEATPCRSRLATCMHVAVDWQHCGLQFFGSCGFHGTSVPQGEVFPTGVICKAHFATPRHQERLETERGKACDASDTFVL